MIKKSEEDQPLGEYSLIVGACVVVGTLDQIREVFDGTKSIKGFYCRVEPAPRPDFVDILMDCGLKWKRKSLRVSEWYSKHYDSRRVRKHLGEEDQVIMSVKIEEP